MIKLKQNAGRRFSEPGDDSGLAEGGKKRREGCQICFGTASKAGTQSTHSRLDIMPSLFSKYCLMGVFFSFAIL